MEISGLIPSRGQVERKMKRGLHAFPYARYHRGKIVVSVKIAGHLLSFLSRCGKFRFMNDLEMRDMLIDYMGRGFLDNIIALFKQDPTVYRFIPDMLGAENMRVRLGATALVEELVVEHRNELREAVPGLIELLKHENPTIRGDVASALGMIKDPSAVDALQACVRDAHPGVREAASDALSEIGQ